MSPHKEQDKVCLACGELKSLQAFRRDPRVKVGGYSANCKACDSQEGRVAYKTSGPYNSICPSCNNRQLDLRYPAGPWIEIRACDKCMAGRKIINGEVAGAEKDLYLTKRRIEKIRRERRGLNSYLRFKA